MQKRDWIFIVLIILAVGSGIAWYKLSPDSFKAVFVPAKTEQANQFQPAGATIATTTNGMTRQEAPANVTIPEPGATSQNSNVAVPETSVPAAPGVSAKLRTFEISASGGKYIPSTIIVKEGDTVHINFKSEDGTYDIVFPDYGLSQQAKQGETKIVEFQANINGQFTFFCKNACPKGTMQGTLIVSPK